MLVTALLAGAALAAPERWLPVEPANDSVVGPRPIFQIDHGTGPAEVRDLRFRLSLRREGDAEPAYRFDQRRRPTGWSPGEDGRTVFHPRRPIADGSYRWSVEVWDGVGWSAESPAFRLRVDSVPPGEVGGLRLEPDAADGLRLRWDPVTLDVRGGPEFVARYHVYRFAERPPSGNSPLHEIGVTVDPWFTIAAADDPAASLLFYRVTAEDAAGNETGRRRP